MPTGLSSSSWIVWTLHANAARSRATSLGSGPPASGSTKFGDFGSCFGFAAAEGSRTRAMYAHVSIAICANVAFLAGGSASVSSQ